MPNKKLNAKRGAVKDEVEFRMIRVQLPEDPKTPVPTSAEVATLFERGVTQPDTFLCCYKSISLGYIPEMNSSCVCFHSDPGPAKAQSYVFLGFGWRHAYFVISVFQCGRNNS